VEEAVALDKQVLAIAQKAGRPIRRVSVLLATHLQHLGDALRHDGSESVSPIYKEAETRATEVLETYPNQSGTRFMLDLIRHGKSLLIGQGAPPDWLQLRLAVLEPSVDKTFGQGFGRFRFGMSISQVNALLVRPFDVSRLPRAREYRTGDVRYFWVPISNVTDFRSLYESPLSCLDQSNDYVVFMFHENSLLRLSFRLWGRPRPSCRDRGELFPELARKYRMPLLGTPKQWRLHWETMKVAIIGTTFKQGPMLDIVEK
jgi:hypothetical protein